MEKKEVCGGGGGISREKGRRDEHSPPTKIPPPLQAAGSGPPLPHPSFSKCQHPRRQAASPRIKPGSSGSRVLFRNSPEPPDQRGSQIGCRRGLCGASQFGPESQRRPGTNLCSLGSSLGFHQPRLAAWRSGWGAAGGLRWCPAPSRGRPL